MDDDLIQETDAPEDHFCSGLSMLRANSFKSPSTTIPTNGAATSQHPPCFACGCSGESGNGGAFNAMKRPPSSPSRSSCFLKDPVSSRADSEPTHKKLVLDPEDHLLLRGFSKITLPIPFGLSDPDPPPTFTLQSQSQAPAHSPPLLRRTFSDPCNPPSPAPERVNQSVDCFTPSSGGKGSGAASALPPLPSTLRRTVSDPTGADIAKKESPSTKRLKRMKDRLREMSEWCNEVLHDHEQEEAQTEEPGGAKIDDQPPKDNPAEEFEESVAVERMGEALCIRFKCPCGKGYKILLNGKNCFYKLV